jgi:Tfp pilus assembly protein PilF
MAKVINKQIPSKNAQTKPLKNVVAALIITGLTLCLYFPILQYKFTNDDDIALIKDNYIFLSNVSNINEIFTHSVFYNTFKVTDTYYRPVLILSFFYDTQIAGKHYWFFYLTNILLHIGCCILLLFLLQMLLYDKTRSLLFTLLFAVHPVFAQAVAWLPGRNDTLLTLFSLLSFYFLLKQITKKKILYQSLHLFFFAVALLTKETAIFLPILFLLYIWLFMPATKGISFIKKLSEFKIEIVGWIIMVFAFLYIRHEVLGSSVGMPLAFTLTNLIYNLPAIIQFTGKILLPFHLNTLPVLQDIPIYYGLATVAVIIYFVWRSKQRDNKRIIFGALWLLIFLAPAILRTSTSLETLFLEHRLYFPMIGFMIICMETDIVKKSDFNKGYARIIIMSVAAFLFVLTWIHCGDYKDEYSFWKSAADDSPHSSAALRGLASYYQSNQQVDKAEQLYIQCLKLNPSIAEVKNNLGRIYMDRGNDSLAEKLFYEEIEVNPLSSMAYYNLGHIRFAQAKYAEAEQMMHKALLINPDDAVTENDLAACLAMQKKYEEAIKLCFDILDKYPTYKYPIDYIKQIFSVWEDKGKIAYYKDLLNKKGIVF